MLRVDGFHLRLDVQGYERERQGRDSLDDNWLTGVVTLEVTGSPAAAFKAKCDVALQTTDLAAFQEALRTLLDDLSGVAAFSTLEDQVELTIRLASGKGTVEGRLEAHAVGTAARGSVRLLARRKRRSGRLSAWSRG